MQVGIYDNIIYTDGSSLMVGDTWIGGIGAIILKGDLEVQDTLSKGFTDCTIGRAEGMAVLESLRYLEDNRRLANATTVIFSDAEYIVKGYNLWMDRWHKNNWMNGYTGEYRKNYEVFRELYHYKHYNAGNILLKHVKGHSGNEYNEEAHDLATAGRLSVMPKLI